MLEDDGGSVVLWESNVIVRYLCARYPRDGMYPETLAARFEAEKWMDWQQTTLNPAGRGAFIQLIRTPAAERDAAVIAQSAAATEPLLAMLDAHLAHHEYLSGDRFTMADIPVACEAHRWFNLPQPRSAWPHLERWYEAMRARPASIGVLDQPLA
jgi:glutathione S-transferase